MPNYRAEARRAAKRHGINPVLFTRQIGAESDFDPNARSPAGAGGIAQIMPGTARAWGVDPSDPIASLDAAAREMGKYVKAYGSYRIALIAYNAGPGRVGKPLYDETRAYIEKILKGGGDGGSEARDGRATTRTVTTPAQTTIDTAGASAAALLSGRKNVLLEASRLLGTGNYTTTTPAQQRQVAELFEGSAPSARGSAGAGNVKVAAGANRSGVNLKPITKDFVGKVAGIYGKTLTITTGTAHDRLTSTNNVSDHWSGNGADIAAEGKPLLEMGRAALIAAGMNRQKAMRVRGGAFTLVKGGKRIQVIFNSNVGGNHYNHLHVGIQ